MRDPQQNQSGGSATEFLVVAVVATIGTVLAIFAFPSLLSSGRGEAPPATAAVERANEAAAIASLRAIASAESAYAAINGSYGDLDELSSGGTVDSRWTGKPAMNGYRFELTVDPASSKAFCATATLAPGQTGGYSYAISNLGVIYQLAGNEPPDCDARTGAISTGTILGG